MAQSKLNQLLNYGIFLNVGSTYSFNTVAPTILQSNYNNATLVARGNYDLASQYSYIDVLHKNIYPILLNSETGYNTYPNDTRDYEYFIFKLPTNTLLVLQSSWIIPASVTEMAGLTLSITLNNVAEFHAINKIVSAITGLGYTNVVTDVTEYTNNEALCQDTTIVISPSETVPVVTRAPTPHPVSIPVPQGTFALFGAGAGDGVLSTTSVYTYSTNTAVSGGDLAYASSYLAAAGNSTIGVFGSGSRVSNVSIYIYSTNVSNAGTYLTYAPDNEAAAGNSTIGIFGGGYGVGGGCPVSTTSVYTYATNITSSGGNLSYSAGFLSAVGNSTVAIFGMGSTCFIIIGSPSTTSIYTYATNNAVTGTNLTYGAWWAATAGNSTIGVFGWGSTDNSNNSAAGNINFMSITSVYTYATNTAVAGGDLNNNNAYGAAAGNSTIGVFGGGYSWDASGDISTTNIYTYSTNIAVAGGNLSYAAQNLAACAPNPGVNM